MMNLLTDIQAYKVKCLKLECIEKDSSSVELEKNQCFKIRADNNRGGATPKKTNADPKKGAVEEKEDDTIYARECYD